MSDVPVEQLLAQIQRHLDARQGTRRGQRCRSLRTVIGSRKSCMTRWKRPA